MFLHTFDVRKFELVAKFGKKVVILHRKPQKVMQLAKEFIESTCAMMGDQLFSQFLKGLGEEPPVSIRLNPLKCYYMPLDFERRVPWCDTGFYLKTRPQFTFDPLLHAGLYYVQEASSMFIHEVLRQLVTEPVLMLDLCAAPGGKSTTARTRLPHGSVLVCNEPNRRRAQVLSENMQKYGHRDVYVTNNMPRDFRKSKLMFDVVLCDVPCSGEGMFRKDEDAIREWSPQNVEKCWRLQREIVSDIWPQLQEGGLLIYSTCTFNTKENEQNVRWICEELGATMVSVETQPEWNITGSLLPGFEGPVYRFIPGKSQGEGLFMAVMRKGSAMQNAERRMQNAPCTMKILQSTLSVLYGSSQELSTSHKNEAPPPSLALLAALDKDAYPRVELSYHDAIRYLRGEALTLPADTPRGFVIVTYYHTALGFVKNIGSRANNLYPDAWRIRSTHVPQTPPTVLDLPKKL